MRIVKAESVAFQLPPRSFFLIWRVRVALERLEVPSSSSEDSSSSSSSSSSFGKLNLSNFVANSVIERLSDLNQSSTAALDTLEMTEEPRLQNELFPPFPRSKLTFETLSCGFSAFILLMKVEYNYAVQAKSSRKDGLAITCVLQKSNSVVLMPFRKWCFLYDSSIPA
jgi:hypothetical protein